MSIFPFLLLLLFCFICNGSEGILCLVYLDYVKVLHSYKAQICVFQVATDKCIMLFLFLIVCGVIAIIIVKVFPISVFCPFTVSLLLISVTN